MVETVQLNKRLRRIALEVPELDRLQLPKAGDAAKGLVIAGAGVLVIVAASRSEPNTATGLDGALKTLGSQPLRSSAADRGRPGNITYGLYSFAMARYTKM